jgi:hypothetical protein
MVGTTRSKKSHAAAFKSPLISTRTLCENIPQCILRVVRTVFYYKIRHSFSQEFDRTSD